MSHHDTHHNTLDFVAIGLGPFNLGLACLTAPIEELNGVFLDRREKFDWHPGMLLQDTTLQIPFLADLVSLADPTSPFSFLNYIKKQGRMYSFYIKENFLLLRNEYNQYCQWVVEQLSNIQWRTEVTAVHYDAEASCYIVTAQCTKTGDLKIFKAKKLVLGTGTQPWMPACCAHLGEEARHSSGYLRYKEEMQSKKSITIVGGGQSAAEIFYDLLQDIDTKGYALSWITRSPRFFPLEYAKLTLEMTSPEYVDYFHDLPPAKRDHLIANQRHLYKGINQDLIGDIFDLIYTKKLTHDIDVRLRTNSALVKAEHSTQGGGYNLELHQWEQDKHYRHDTEALILATGYTYQIPSFIEEISGRIQWDDQGRYATNRNYSIDKKGEEIFVQNAELHTHGFVTPDLGMACYRNSYIIREMTGKEYYPVENRIAFQQFGVVPEEEILFQKDTLSHS